MDLRSLAQLLIKLAGIIIVVYALIGLPASAVQVFFMLESANAAGLPGMGKAIGSIQFWMMSVAPTLVYVVVGGALFLASDKIAARVTGSSLLQSDQNMDWRQFEEIALYVLGVYFFTEGLAATADWIGLALAEVARTAAPLEHQMQLELGRIASATTRLIAGVALLLGCRGLVSLRHRFLALRPLANRDRYG